MFTIAIDASRATREAKTGVEWYAWHMIQAMKRVAPPEWRVVLLSDRPLSGELAELPDGWESRVLRWPPRYLWSQLRLAAHLKRAGYDLFFSPVHVLPFFTSRPAAVTIHDVDYLTHPEAYSFKGRAYLTLTSRWAVRTAARILVPSSATKHQLISRLRCAPDKIVVTPLAATAWSRVVPGILDAVKARAGIRGRYVLAIGRLETKKNTARTIEAFSHAAQEIPDVTLVLVGRDGRGSIVVHEVLRRAMRTCRIVHIPWLPQEELVALLSGATALLFPSIAEGFGLPVLDGFVAGVPVLTSRGIATEEVAGGAALLVDPGSTADIARGMVRLTTEPRLRDELVAKGKVRAAAFSWEKTASATVSAFQDILEK